VEASQPFSAASSKAIRDFDLKIKPARSAQDMLLLVPGLFIAQHAGGGKAGSVAFTTTSKHQSACLAGYYHHSDGPFESPQGFNRGNIYGKFHTHIMPHPA
jgi:hypothetical protein